MKKIISTLLLAGLAATTLVSCSSTKKEDNANTNQQAVTNEQEEFKFNITKKEFIFDETATKTQIENEIKKYIITNGNVLLSYFTVSVGVKYITVEATYNGETKRDTVIVSIKKVTQPDELTFSISKTTFEFNYGVTKAEIETEVKKYITTNGTVEFSDYDLTVGTYMVFVAAKKNDDIQTQSISISIKATSQTNELTFSISKTTFEFTYGVTKAEVENEIKKYITTNGTVSFTDFDVTLGEKYVYVSSSLNLSSKSQSITIIINASSSQTDELTFNISKTTFEFNKGVTKTAIEAEVKKYITTNGTVEISDFDLTVGSHSVFVTASKGNKSSSQSITIIIKAEAQAEDLTLTITKSAFTFYTNDTTNYIETEILKYVSSNGQITVSGIENTIGSHTVTIFAALNGKSKFETINLTIAEPAKIEATKTSFEFDYGTTANEMKTEIEKFITTNGTLTYSTLSDNFAVGSHSVRIFATKNNTSDYKDITVVIADKGVIKLTKEDFEFKHGTTYKEVKEEVSKYIITNCDIAFPTNVNDSDVFNCSTFEMPITGTYKNEKVVYKVGFTVVPDDTMVKVISLGSRTTTSTKQTYSIEFTNNSGKAIKSMKIAIFIFVDNIVRSDALYQYDSTGISSTNTLEYGETETMNCTINYNSAFTSYSVDYIGERDKIGGYDYNFFKSYTGTVKYRWYIYDIVYA